MEPVSVESVGHISVMSGHDAQIDSMEFLGNDQFLIPFPKDGFVVCINQPVDFGVIEHRAADLPFGQIGSRHRRLEEVQITAIH
jgi:hypothetical protein